MKKAQGFTLMEAMIAIVIIAILAAILLPILFKGIRYAKRIKAKAELRDQAITHYVEYGIPERNAGMSSAAADAPHPLLRMEKNFWPDKLDPYMEPE